MISDLTLRDPGRECLHLYTHPRILSLLNCLFYESCVSDIILIIDRNALNVGASVMKYQIRDVLESQVCFRIKEQVSTTLQEELSTLPGIYYNY